MPEQGAQATKPAPPPPGASFRRVVDGNDDCIILLGGRRILSGGAGLVQNRGRGLFDRANCGRGWDRHSPLTGALTPSLLKIEDPIWVRLFRTFREVVSVSVYLRQCGLIDMAVLAEGRGRLSHATTENGQRGSVVGVQLYCFGGYLQRGSILTEIAQSRRQADEDVGVLAVRQAPCS